MDNTVDNSYKTFIHTMKQFIVDYLIKYHNIESMDDTLEEQVYEYIFDNIETFLSQILSEVINDTE